MLINLLTSCSRSERQKIIEVLDEDWADESQGDTKFVLNLMKEHGSIDYGKRNAKEFASESKGVLSNRIAPLFKSDSAAKTIFDLVDFVTNREFQKRRSGGA
jgi:geranylgeranyl pyrophosphate synthase